MILVFILFSRRSKQSIVDGTNVTIVKWIIYEQIKSIHCVSFFVGVRIYQGFYRFSDLGAKVTGRALHFSSLYIVLLLPMKCVTSASDIHKISSN